MFYQGKRLRKEGRIPTLVKLKLYHFSIATTFQKAALGDLWLRRQMNITDVKCELCVGKGKVKHSQWKRAVRDVQK